MLTKEQREMAEKLWASITTEQCDDDVDVEELRYALGACLTRFDNDNPPPKD